MNPPMVLSEVISLTLARAARPPGEKGLVLPTVLSRNPCGANQLLEREKLRIFVCSLGESIEIVDGKDIHRDEIDVENRNNLQNLVLI